MKSNIFKILKKELRETVRDSKSLSMMFVIPLFIPFLIIGFSAFYNSMIEKDVSEYNRIGFNYELSEAEKIIMDELEIDAIEISTNSLKEAYDNGELDLYVIREGSNYTINGDDNETTTYATTLVESYFAIYKEYLQTEYLNGAEMNANEVINIITLEYNITEEESFVVTYILGYAFTFILMAIVVSATYPSTDATAGEKERGTLETLLTFPLKSRDIIIGKFINVSLFSIITGLISLVLAIISCMVSNNLFEIYKDAPLSLSLGSIIYAAVMIIVCSVLVSGLCIAIASKSKTFKEAQSALTPITFIVAFPGMIATMIGLESTTITSLIPFLNISLIFNDIAVGNVNILHITLALLSTIIIIVVVFKIIIKQYKSEKVLFSE